MSEDLRLVREFGERLEPPAGRLPDDLRRRVLAGAPTAHRPRRLRLPMRFAPVRRPWRPSVMARVASAVAAAVALAVLVLPGGIGAPPRPPSGPTATAVQTVTEVLRLAAGHVALAPAPAARPDQFIFSESVAVFDELRNPGGWTLKDPPRTLLREWRPVGGTGEGLALQRPAAQADGPWQITPIPACQSQKERPDACLGVRDLTTDSDLMYEFLYRSTNDDISPTHAALIGKDDLAFERAVRILYLSQTFPAVQAAVLTAMDRIPGVGVSAGATDVTGRHGVGLARRGPLGTTELVFDAGTYRYLGSNLTVGPTGRIDAADGFSTWVLTRQAVLRVAIVDRLGDVP